MLRLHDQLHLSLYAFNKRCDERLLAHGLAILLANLPDAKEQRKMMQRILIVLIDGRYFAVAFQQGGKGVCFRGKSL